MTHFIAHRINTLAALQELPTRFGAEIDLRDWGERLILQHDPFIDGEDFEPFLAAYQHGTLILNVKSERIEHRVLTLLRQYGITNYFFLDSSFPMLYALSQLGETALAVRFSEFEPIESVIAMKHRVKWVWVDCFTRLPLTAEDARQLQDNGLKLCLVSPELQGRSEDIIPYRDWLTEQGIRFDAICTKQHNIHLWQTD